MNKRRVNICRPGFGASCGLCCGSHNFNLPHEEIEVILRNRSKNTLMESLHQYNSLFGKKFSDGMQCPHIALSDDNELFCLIYNEPEKDESVRAFFNGTCRNFYCAAWDYLSDEEVLFAARLFGDWFYYGLLINDIDTLKELYGEYGNPANIPESAVESLKLSLLDMAFEF